MTLGGLDEGTRDHVVVDADVGLAVGQADRVHSVCDSSRVITLDAVPNRDSEMAFGV